MNEWTGAASLLCVQFGSIGDVLACTPALRALRAQCPGRKVALLASPAGAVLGPYLPDVDTVLAHEAPWMSGAAAAAHLDWTATLAAQRVDGAVIFTRHGESALPAALLCQLARIPLRAAYCRERPYQLLTHPIPDPEPGAMRRHPAQRQLDLVRRLGAETADERLAFVSTPTDVAAVHARLRAAGIDPAQRWLLVDAGAGAMAGRHSQPRWSDLILALHARIGCPLVLTGATHESAMNARVIATGAQVHSLAGRPNLGERGALLSLASAVLSANRETVLLASAAGTPVVVLGGTDDATLTPWQVTSRVLRHEVACSALLVEVVCNLLRQTGPAASARSSAATKKASPKTGLSD